MPFSDRDIQQIVAIVRGEVARIPQQQNSHELLTMLSDVSIGDEDGVAPLANGDVLTWVAGQSAWENAPASAGSGFPVDAFYGESALVVAASDAEDVSWTLGNGPAILDLSTPTLPTAVADGLFIFTVEATTGDTLTAWSLFVVVREGGPTNRIARFDPISGPGTVTATLGVAMTAGDPIRIAVSNSDGASSGTFSLNITVASLS